MGNRRRGSGSRGKRNGYYWDGLQWPATALTTAPSLFELIGQTAQEFMPGTLVRIRGFIALRGAHASSMGDCVQKIMYVELNDAGTMTGDHAGIDTHEEDIAQRQLWTHHAVVGHLDASPEVVIIEVDVRVKIRLEPHSKKALILLADVVTNGTVTSSGYLRCLVQYS